MANKDRGKERKKKKSGIHIRPENKGKFTAYAKSKGEGVQQAASAVLSNPDASAQLKRRAVFARVAPTWHHGGS